MQLFYLINSWAGRSEWLDSALRFFYVGAVPLLATALAALLILAPKSRDSWNYVAPRRRVAFAAVLSLGLCALAVGAVSLFQQQVLNGVPISPRPFMTHWVRALVVEPNDNSFPSFEVMLAAAIATLLWARSPGAGVLAWCAVFLLGFARIFCGMNYMADSLAGAVIGGAISSLALALVRVPLQLPSFQKRARRASWRVRHQAVFSVLSFAGFAVFAAYSLSTSPAHGVRFKNFWGSEATAAPSTPGGIPIGGAPAGGLHSGIHEGEGGTLAPGNSGGMAAPGEMLLASRAARLDGHLPKAETLLTKALEVLHLPHRIMGVNVAQVRAGNSAYRVAAIRFEVKQSGSRERRRVAQTAMECVKRAFHADGQLQHVDILGVKMAADRLPEYNGKGGVRPVFTASIERSDLIVKNKAAWVNWSKLDGGAWLRARSALFIDAAVLPSAPLPLVAAPPVVPINPVVPDKPQTAKKPVIRKPITKKPIRKKTRVKKRAAKKPIARKKPVVRRKPAVKRFAAPQKRKMVRRSRRRSAVTRRRYRTRRYRARRYSTRRYRRSR